MAALAACDAALGTCQLLIFNRPHLQTTSDWALAGVALAAPIGAALILGLGAAMRERLYVSAP